MYGLEKFKIGQKIITPLGGEAEIYEIDRERIYFQNGRFKMGIFCGIRGCCHYSDIKKIISTEFIHEPSDNEVQQ